MTGQKASGQRRLTRDDWITAALGAIADGGLAAVGVEPLAARLGATKGSFYWHFENRDALLEAAIRRWEKETTTDMVAEITAAHDAPASQFRRLVVGVIERAPARPLAHHHGRPLTSIDSQLRQRDQACHAPPPKPALAAQQHSGHPDATALLIIVLHRSRDTVRLAQSRPDRRVGERLQGLARGVPIT